MPHSAFKASATIASPRVRNINPLTPYRSSGGFINDHRLKESTLLYPWGVSLIRVIRDRNVQSGARNHTIVFYSSLLPPYGRRRNPIKPQFK